MNTQDLDDAARFDRDTCDGLEELRIRFARLGQFKEEALVEKARLYIAHLRDKVNTIDLTPPSIIAPVGFDGLICGDWLAEQVERRMEALRDEAVCARQRHDQADDALSGFANAIRDAAR
jgi:hypothetical protein